MKELPKLCMLNVPMDIFSFAMGAPDSENKESSKDAISLEMLLNPLLCTSFKTGVTNPLPEPMTRFTSTWSNRLTNVSIQVAFTSGTYKDEEGWRDERGERKEREEEGSRGGSDLKNRVENKREKEEWGSV